MRRCQNYAAFELRYAVERLAVHYWAELLGRRFEQQELRDIESFKTVERRIYELAGHQREIDGHFEFMRVLLGYLKISTSPKTPNIGELSRYWHGCSEMCHIAWVLASGVPDLRDRSFHFLTDACNVLGGQLKDFGGWPSIQAPALIELRNKFITGKATSDDVYRFLKKGGAWARVEHPDGRMEFAGEAISPNAVADSN